MKHNLQIGQAVTATVVVCEGTVAAEAAAAGDTMSLGGSVA